MTVADRIYDAQCKVTKAFALARKRGIIARQRFRCCNSCAGYAISQDVEDMVSRRASNKERIKGVAFYSTQGGFRESERWNRKRDEVSPQVTTTKHGVVGLPTVEVGKLLCECLTEAGLAYEWDGEEHSCILVKAEPPPAIQRVANDAVLAG
jgi:hypothetical protein